MSTPASSPSPTPSKPSPSKLQAQCICALSEITTQLSNEDTIVRFQCLAYHRYGRSPTQRRCEGSCKIQSRPLVFERAKQILQQKAPVTYVDYVGIVIRILFCKTHSESKAFGKYRDLFQHHWKGDGNPKELELLEAIRQAHQLPSVHPIRGPNIVESSSSLSSNPSRSKPDAEGLDLNVQLNTSFIPPDTERVTGAPPGKGQPAAFAGPSLAQRRHLLPVPPSQRMRSRSNPPQQRNETSPAAEPSIHTAGGATEDNAPIHAPSNPYGIPSKGSFEFSYPALNIPFTLRQVRNEAPNLNTAIPAQTSSSHNSDNSLSRTPVPSEQVSDTPPEIISSSSLPDGSEPIDHNRNSFVQADWDSCDFSSSFHPSGLGKNRFKPTAMEKRSKDDTFVEQLSSSAANAAPTLFEATTQDSVPIPEPSNGPGKNVKSFIPVVVDTWIRKAIMKPVTKEGHVYILKAPKYFEENYPGEPPLVKIGIAVDVKKRISDLRNDCGLFDLEDVAVPWYFKVEELAHSELANFNRVLKCGKCRTGKGERSAHREWFAVSETVALQTVQRWRRFIHAAPYDENGILTDHWSEMVKYNNINWQAADEEYGDHERRHKRWDRWLEEGIKATRRLK
jgi:hypothetical protein